MIFSWEWVRNVKWKLILSSKTCFPHKESSEMCKRVKKKKFWTCKRVVLELQFYDWISWEAVLGITKGRGVCFAYLAPATAAVGCFDQSWCPRYASAYADDFLIAPNCWCQTQKKAIIAGEKFFLYCCENPNNKKKKIIIITTNVGWGVYYTMSLCELFIFRLFDNRIFWTFNLWGERFEL